MNRRAVLCLTKPKIGCTPSKRCWWLHWLDYEHEIMIVAIDVDAQKTFTPLFPKELPVAQGDEIVAELNAQAALADLRVMSKDAHSLHAHWLVDSPSEMMRPTGLPHADLTWVAHAIVGTEGYELLDGLPESTEYDFVFGKALTLPCILMARVFTIWLKNSARVCWNG